MDVEADIKRLLEGQERIAEQLAALRSERSTGAMALTISAAAVALSCGPSKVKSLLRTGVLLSVRVGGTRLIPRREIERLLALPARAEKKDSPRAMAEKVRKRRR